MNWYEYSITYDNGRVTYRYAENVEDLLKSLANIKRWNSLPHVRKGMTITAVHIY